VLAMWLTTYLLFGGFSVSMQVVYKLGTTCTTKEYRDILLPSIIFNLKLNLAELST